MTVMLNLCVGENRTSSELSGPVWHNRYSGGGRGLGFILLLLPARFTLSCFLLQASNFYNEILPVFLLLPNFRFLPSLPPLCLSFLFASQVCQHKIRARTYTGFRALLPPPSFLPQLALLSLCLVDFDRLFL